MAAQATAILLESENSLQSLLGKPRILHLSEALEDNFAQIIVAVTAPEQYSFLPESVQPFRVRRAPQQDPVHALASAMSGAEYERAFVLLSGEIHLDFPLIQRLLDEVEGWECLLAKRNGCRDPFFGVYTWAMLEGLEAAAAQGETDLEKCLEAFRWRCLSEAPMSTREGAEP